MMRKKKGRIGILLSVAMIVGLCLLGCGKSSKNEKLIWPTSGISQVLPVPDFSKGHIGLDLKDMFSADIYDVSAEKYNDYAEKCQEKGFVIDGEEKSDVYEAYNEEGYELTLSYYNEKMSIHLNAPKVNEALVWPTMGLAMMLPTPEAEKGSISNDSSSTFSAYVGETSIETYNAYVDACIANGFNVDYSRNEKVYSADNENGDSLRVEYEGFNTMYISIRISDKSNEESASSEISTEADTAEMKETTAEETAGTNASEELADGMRVEFKEAMDSYEEFFDEYCAFMKKYAETDASVSMLADYSSYLTKYADTMEKLDAVDEDELNDAELKYYTDTMLRINEKLLESAQ